MMGVSHALRLGVTNVIVEDTRVAGHIQVSSLNVVLPDFLSLHLLPLSISGDPMDGIEAVSSMARWHVVLGRQYLIQIKIFSQGLDAHEIYITEVCCVCVSILKHNVNLSFHLVVIYVICLHLQAVSFFLHCAL